MGKEPWVVHTIKEKGWTLDPGRKRWRKIFVSYRESNPCRPVHTLIYTYWAIPNKSIVFRRGHRRVGHKRVAVPWHFSEQVLNIWIGSRTKHIFKISFSLSSFVYSLFLSFSLEQYSFFFLLLFLAGQVWRPNKHGGFTNFCWTNMM
jgi:hypothetical protein